MSERHYGHDAHGAPIGPFACKPDDVASVLLPMSFFFRLRLAVDRLVFPDRLALGQRVAFVPSAAKDLA